jgi:uncharacterized protein Yka (UPF0111/DUF47 family)
VARKKEDDYFVGFQEMVDVSKRAVEKLRDIFSDFDPATLQLGIEELHAIEYEGDKKKHALLRTLARDFITPIDREDIFAIAGELDDVTDSIEDVLLKAYMYNIQSVLPGAMEMVSVAVKCCYKLHEVMTEFADFRRSKTIQEKIVELNHLEEQSDRLYLQAVHTLYVKHADPGETAGWTEIYNCLEKCCDTCEHVADVVEGVIMKNT